MLHPKKRKTDEGKSKEGKEAQQQNDTCGQSYRTSCRRRCLSCSEHPRKRWTDRDCAMSENRVDRARRGSITRMVDTKHGWSTEWLVHSMIDEQRTSWTAWLMYSTLREQHCWYTASFINSMFDVRHAWSISWLMNSMVGTQNCW